MFSSKLRFEMRLSLTVSRACLISRQRNVWSHDVFQMPNHAVSNDPCGQNTAVFRRQKEN